VLVLAMRRRELECLVGPHQDRAVTALFPENSVDVAYYVDLAPLVLLRHHLPNMYI
jgi:hypothetical protein